jgi:hypothetical protein
MFSKYLLQIVSTELLLVFSKIKDSTTKAETLSANSSMGILCNVVSNSPSRNVILLVQEPDFYTLGQVITVNSRNFLISMASSFSPSTTGNSYLLPSILL